MPPKRKADTLLEKLDAMIAARNPEALRIPGLLSVKQPRVADATDAPSASSSAAKKDKPKPTSWKEVELEGEDEGDVPVFDDCNDIRRKIRALGQEPGFKITAWLREIGKINNNSYGRFMKASGPTGGAENGTYYAAYMYFEKRRIFEGKKKTAKRLRAEEEFPLGRPLQDARRQWVLGPA